MFIRPWGTALDDAERQTWIADGHDFGVLGVNGLPGRSPLAVPAALERLCPTTPPWAPPAATTLAARLRAVSTGWDTAEEDRVRPGCTGARFPAAREPSLRA
jgi:hypothetical protein